MAPRTFPSCPDTNFMTLASFQKPLGVVSYTSTTSPMLTELRFFLWLSLSSSRYSVSQKLLRSLLMCTNLLTKCSRLRPGWEIFYHRAKWEDVKGSSMSSLSSLETYEMGRELMTHSTSVIKVISSSGVSLALPTIFLRQCLVVRIMRSNTPPHHGALGRLKVHVIPTPDK